MSKNVVKDYGTPFVFDGTTKQITNSATRKPVLVKGDHNCEQFTFECSRYVEGYDLSKCTKIEIHYMNMGTSKEKSSGIYTVEDAHIGTKLTKPLTFTWLLSNNATKNAGVLSFKLRFVTLNGEEVEYELNSEPYSDIVIADTQDNSEDLEGVYLDIIEQWKSSVMDELSTQMFHSVDIAVETRTSVLEARMNTFTKMSNNGMSTAAEAELYDVRVGADGTVYDTAGEAVRGQVGKLSEDIDYLTKNTAALDSNDAESIPANSDADTYTTPGNYKVNSTTVAETIANLPENISGRLTVYESYMTNRLLQTYVTSTSVPRLYVRSYNGSKWYDWEKIITASKVAEIVKNSIVSSNISITKNNYTEYFTDFNDIPVNTVYAIEQDIPLLNSPPGNNMVDRAGETSGYMAGTVLTCSGNSTSVRARFQIFMGQTSAQEQSVMCFRSGYPSDGVIKWYPWQTFSDRKALTATNIAVRKEIAQEVLPSMDDAEINTIYQIDLDCDDGTILNHPNPGQSCVLITFGFSHTSRHGMVQMCFGIGGATKMFYRYGYKQSSTEYRWTDWEKVFTESSETSEYLKNMGRLPDGSDLDNITGNVIYLVGDNAGNQNTPTEKAGFITSKTVKNITLHTYEALTGERYSRYAVAGEWHEWVEG